MSCSGEHGNELWDSIERLEILACVTETDCFSRSSWFHRVIYLLKIKTVRVHLQPLWNKSLAC
jgi:hypothetical protein